MCRVTEIIVTAWSEEWYESRPTEFRIQRQKKKILAHYMLYHWNMFSSNHKRSHSICHEYIKCNHSFLFVRNFWFQCICFFFFWWGEKSHLLHQKLVIFRYCYLFQRTTKKKLESSFEWHHSIPCIEKMIQLLYKWQNLCYPLFVQSVRWMLSSAFSCELIISAS